VTDRADVVRRLRAAGCVWAEDEAELLLASGGDVEAKVARRESGEPLEVVLGFAELAGVACSSTRACSSRAPQQAARACRARSGRGDGPAGGRRPLLRHRCVGAGVVAVLPAYDLHAADLDPWPWRARGATSSPSAAPCTRATCTTRCRPGS
jgi:release factor glutamine methyltransferase